MNGLGRSERSLFRSRGDVHVNDMVCPQVKQVSQPGSSEPLSVVKMSVVDVRDVAERLALPCTDEYQLRDMLKAGVLPQEVPVSGILDSTDPTDPQNVGAAGSLYSSLADRLPKDSEPSQPVTPVTPDVQPSNVE